MKWTTEKMVEEMKGLLGDRLTSVVLYGSSAGGDHSGKNSDVNLLVVTHSLGRTDLQKLSKAVVPWVNQGNPAPMFLSLEHLKNFVDVFPLEIHDIQTNHQVLFGPDPVDGLEIELDHLRMELNHEFQGKLLRLKSKFVLTEARPQVVLKLMVESLSTFMVLLRNALLLFGEKPPARKMEALRQLRVRLEFDLSVFETLDSLKRGENTKDLDVLSIFDKYLGALEDLAVKISEK